MVGFHAPVLLSWVLLEKGLHGYALIEMGCGGLKRSIGPVRAVSLIGPSAQMLEGLGRGGRVMGVILPTNQVGSD